MDGLGGGESDLTLFFQLLQTPHGYAHLSAKQFPKSLAAFVRKCAEGPIADASSTLAVVCLLWRSVSGYKCASAFS